MGSLGFGCMTSKRLVRKDLWRLWCDALGHPAGAPIIDEQNFFESGGDSLMAMMLHAGIEDQLQQRVELADVLDVLADANFKALAELVGGATPDDDSASCDFVDP